MLVSSIKSFSFKGEGEDRNGHKKEAAVVGATAGGMGVSKFASRISKFNNGVINAGKSIKPVVDQVGTIGEAKDVFASKILSHLRSFAVSLKLDKLSMFKWIPEFVARSKGLKIFAGAAGGALAVSTAFVGIANTADTFCKVANHQAA